MRLNDFINGKQLSKDEKKALELVGAKKGFLDFGNNLYDNPSAAAGATIVLLKSNWDEYENFKSKLDTEHDKIGEKLTSKALDTNEALQKCLSEGHCTKTDIDYSKMNIDTTSPKLPAVVDYQLAEEYYRKAISKGNKEAERNLLQLLKALENR